MDFYKFVTSLSDEEIKTLRSALYDVQETRDDVRLASGLVPELSDYEKSLVKGISPNVIAAIKEYRSRTGESLHLSKAVVDKYIAEELSAG